MNNVAVNWYVEAKEEDPRSVIKAIDPEDIAHADHPELFMVKVLNELEYKLIHETPKKV